MARVGRSLGAAAYRRALADRAPVDPGDRDRRRPGDPPPRRVTTSPRGRGPHRAAPRSPQLRAGVARVGARVVARGSGPVSAAGWVLRVGMALDRGAGRAREGELVVGVAGDGPPAFVEVVVAGAAADGDQVVEVGGPVVAFPPADVVGVEEQA